MRALINPHRGPGLSSDTLAPVPFPSTSARQPLDYLTRCPRAGETPLVQSADLAARAGVGEIWIKDERDRMGLGSFKALGAAYVIACDHAEGTAKGATYVTASAGNHGLSVAAGAAAFGAKSRVFISEQVPEDFAGSLRDVGAEVVREGADYEASMAAAARAAAERGDILLSDSSWPGYLDRPYRLMEGYLVLMDEVFARMEGIPTHIFLQAGVGGLAGAAAAAARAHWGDAPRIVVVEPDAAPALIASVEAGEPVHAPGPESVMGRLDCKDPSLIALKGLARDADVFLTITEEDGLAGAALAGEAGFPTSPSGAAGLAGVVAGRDAPELALGPDARVLGDPERNGPAVTKPDRGFPKAEFQARVARAQALMAGAGIDALLLTTEPEVRYFSGFLTRFWDSPTRPWFLVVPGSGDPVAVIPSIGAHLMGQGWLSDIRTWQSPDYTDDGVGLLGETLREHVPEAGRVGVPDGAETHLRMPLGDWGRLSASLGTRTVGGDDGIIRRLRMVKSPLEIAKIRHACAIAGRAFQAVPGIAGAGDPLEAVFRRFQAACLAEGADWVGYLAGGAGPDGYGDVISPASDAPLAAGDVLMLDTGAVWDGYYCDFDRNFAVEHASPAAQAGYRRLIEATDRAFEIARPGATAADLFHAMDHVTTGGRAETSAGRLGHGLGMQLTEWPSLIPDDRTVLEPGMVLTLEPSVEVAPGRFIVHEENIVITEGGANYLSPLAERDLPVLEVG